VADENPLLAATEKSEHVCEYCHEPPDGTEQLGVLADKAVWLHPRCQRPYLDLDIPPSLRRAP